MGSVLKINTPERVLKATIYFLQRSGVARGGQGVYHPPGATRRGASQMISKTNKIYIILLYVFLEGGQ